MVISQGMWISSAPLAVVFITIDLPLIAVGVIFSNVMENPPESIPAILTVAVVSGQETDNIEKSRTFPGRIVKIRRSILFLSLAGMMIDAGERNSELGTDAYTGNVNCSEPS